MLLVCHTTDVSYKTDDSTLTSLFSLKRGSFSFFFLFFLKNFLLFWPSKLRWKAPLSSVRRFVRSSKSPLAPRERERNRERRYLFTAQRVPLLSRFIRTKERSQNIRQKNTLTHTSQKASCDHTARACTHVLLLLFLLHYLALWWESLDERARVDVFFVVVVVGFFDEESSSTTESQKCTFFLRSRKEER